MSCIYILYALYSFYFVYYLYLLYVFFFYSIVCMCCVYCMCMCDLYVFYCIYVCMYFFVSILCIVWMVCILAVYKYYIHLQNVTNIPKNVYSFDLYFNEQVYMYIYTSAYSQSVSILLSRYILVDADLMQYKLHNCEQDFYIILVIYKLKKIIAITLLNYRGYQAKPPFSKNLS